MSVPPPNLGSMALMSGATFAGYRIIRPLGSGGMGEVYLAEHPRLPRCDALKILPATISADPEFRERFQREADSAATLFHPHIVGVHDRGEVDGQLWIAMDFVDGPDAGRLIRDRYPAGMPREEAVEIISAIASALDYAHGRGLLHRDVKPANILLTSGRQRRILLADFGIARAVNETHGVTGTGMAVGTVDYAAPEQLTDAAVDGRTDEYALAATAFHLLTGVPPYRHSSPAVTIGRHLSGQPASIAAVRPDLAALDQPLRVALSSQPGGRYPSCEHFAAALGGTAGSAVAAAAPTQAAPTQAAPRRIPPAAPAKRTPRPSRPPRPGLLAGCAAAGLLVGAGALGGLGTAVDTIAGPAPVTTSTSTATSVSISTRTSVSTSVSTSVPPPSTTTLTETVTARPSSPSSPVSTAGPRVPMTSPAANSRSGQSALGLDPAIIPLFGWEHCVRHYDAARCFDAAREAAGAPPGSPPPLTPAGTWAVPAWMKYGEYRAAVGPTGSCLWNGYDVRGRLVDSGFFTRSSQPPTAVVTPPVTTFQTFGCTPWFLVGPLGELR